MIGRGRLGLRFDRSLIAFTHDVSMAALSFVISLWLRLGDALPAFWQTGALALATALFTGIAAVVFLSNRLYRGVWRYASMHDMVSLGRATSLTILLFMACLFFIVRLDSLPRSVLIINWFVLMALLGGPRFAYRLAKDKLMLARRPSEGSIPVLLIGAGDEAELFIRALGRHPHPEYRVVGLLAAKSQRVGLDIHGHQVLGAVDDLEAVLSGLRQRDQAPQRLILTVNNPDGGMVRRLLDKADQLGLPLSRLPKLTDLKSGAEDSVIVRPIAVEDLLGRPQTVLDRDSMSRLIAGKRILVTGAGGSIGSELVRQVSDLNPAEIALFDSCEFNLYTIDMELEGRRPELIRHPLIGDVRDARRVGAVMARFRPELVFHAAALKHVPMVEANPCEGVLTNVLGTRIVADAARAAGVELMVQISTDKAVNPTNVMGATKRVAENYAQALDLAAGNDDDATRYVTVRFGNVLGSTGSVVPLFQKQLMAGGPITVTHPDMTRYFMTVREAVELVLQAAALGRSSHAHQGKIFVLDMGEPVKIVDLARQMIRLAGLRPETDIAISFTGLRPGEKLFEEIFHGAEPPVATELAGILVAAPRSANDGTLATLIGELVAAAESRDEEATLRRLIRLVPEFIHSPQGGQNGPAPDSTP